MLLLNRELIRRESEIMSGYSVFQAIVKDCLKIKNLPKIFLRSFENVGPDS